MSDRQDEVTQLAIYLHEHIALDHSDPPKSRPNFRGESCETCLERAEAIVAFQEQRQRVEALLGADHLCAVHVTEFVQAVENLFNPQRSGLLIFNEDATRLHELCVKYGGKGGDARTKTESTPMHPTESNREGGGSVPTTCHETGTAALPEKGGSE